MTDLALKASGPEELTRDIIRRFGGNGALAEALADEKGRIGPSAVSNWPTQGGVPGKYHLRLLRLAAESGVELSADELLSTAK